jgi:diadenosine tetraphosphatase ApaH/serine/threonine PP2A family protein phosphatase
VRIAVISDIHANWHAYEAVLADVEQQNVEEIWCLGDLVGYGPQPNRCVDVARERASFCLIGNHDLASIGRVPLDDFAPVAAVSARWTQTELSDGAREYLESLQPSGERPGAQLYHGSPRDPVWEYILDEPAVRAALELTTAPLVLVGHSHIPIALQLVDGNLAGGLAHGGSDLELGGDRWLLNPGSVGQPRDGDPRAAYLVVDTDDGRVHFRRVPYDIERTQAEIREQGLPDTLAARLADGE